MNSLSNLWKQKKHVTASNSEVRSLKQRSNEISTPKNTKATATVSSDDLFLDSFGSSFFAAVDKLEEEYVEKAKTEKNVALNTSGIKRCTPIKNKNNKRMKYNKNATNFDNEEETVIEESQLFDQVTTNLNTENTQIDKLLLSSWGLPECVLEKYHRMNITTMFQWQVDCLALGNVLNGGNLVYSAPTSAGKTLVAEILVLKRILEFGKKAIIILPFISVAREKMFYLQNLFQGLGIRVDGFIGTHHPPGGLKRVDVAVCTIEKANSLINRLLEEKKLHTIGTIVVDELHMLGDPSRGYLLELLLTKVRYMSWKIGLESTPQTENNKSSIQIIGMSATLPNLDLLARWLDADLYHTDFRPVPLFERIKLEKKILDKNFKPIRELPSLSQVLRDPDTENVIQLCLETVTDNHSVLMFCPTKQWCETLAKTISKEFFNLGDNISEETKKKSSPNQLEIHNKLRSVLDGKLLCDVAEQLTRSPCGLDSELKKCIRVGVAFHHAGLTFDERDIIEGAFRKGIIKVLLSTSTLSSGVNLPARRVIVRSPMAFNQIMDVLTYRQMVGRAGRKGIDTEGESILMCKKSEVEKVKTLVSSLLRPISSCLLRSGQDLSSAMKRAILEIIVSGIATSPDEVEQYCASTLLAASCSDQNDYKQDGSGAKKSENAIKSCIKYLMENEFIILHIMGSSDGEEKMKYVPSSLGNAIMASSMSPDDGLIIFRELDRARKNFVLENELHIIYQVTPIHVADQWTNMDWLDYLNMWENLPSDQQRVGELVGVEERFIVRLARNQSVANTKSQHYRKLAIHQRFYTALALHDLVNEVPLNTVARKYNCNRGRLQSLQQSASTFAGMVTSFCNRLGWINLEILLTQFQSRLNFGIQRELCDLVRISLLNGQRARLLYNGGFESIADVANADSKQIETLLKSAGPFQSEKQRDDETDFELKERRKARCIWLMGKEGYTEAEAAQLLVQEARQLLQKDLGVNIEWHDSQNSSSVDNQRNDDVNGSQEKQVHLEKVQIRSSQIGTNFISIPKSKKDEKINDKVLANVEEVQDMNQHNITSNSNSVEDLVDSPDIISASDDEEKRPVNIFSFRAQAEAKSLLESNSRKSISGFDSLLITSQLEKLLDGNISKLSTTPINTAKRETSIITPSCFSPSTASTSTPHPRVNLIKSNTINTSDNSSIEAYMANYITPSRVSKDLPPLNENEEIQQSQPKKEVIPVQKQIQTSRDSQDILPFSENEELQQSQMIISEEEEEEDNLSNLILENTDESINELDNSNDTIQSSQPIVTNKFTKLLRYPLQTEQNVVLANDSLSNDELNNSRRSITEVKKYSSDHNLSKKKFDTALRRVQSDSNNSSQCSTSSNWPFKISDDTMKILNAMTDSDYVSKKRMKNGTNEIEVEKPIPQTKFDLKKITEKYKNSQNWKKKFTGFQKKQPSASTSKFVTTPHSKRKLLFSKKLPQTRLERKESFEEMEYDIKISDSDQSDCESTPESDSENIKTKDKKNIIEDDAFAIIDVGADKQLFETFIEEWKKQSKFSLSLACAKLPTKNQGQIIGAKIKQDIRKKDKVTAKGLEIEEKNLALVGLSVVWEDRDAYFISLLDSNQNQGESPSLSAPPLDPKLSVSIRLNHIQKVLKSRKDCTIIGYDLKEHLRLLNITTGAFPTCQIEDPKIGVWLLNPTDNPKTLHNLVLEFCPDDKHLLEHVGGTLNARSIGLTPETRGSPRVRSAVEAVITFRVMSQVGRKLKDEKLIKIFKEIEMPTILLLCKMELNGLGFNTEEFRKQIQIIEKKLSNLEEKAHQIAGRRFSLKSTVEVAKVLFGELGLHPNGEKDDHLNTRRKQTSRQVWKRSKEYNTNKTTLQKMAANHPLPSVILEHRKLTSALDNMILPLLKMSLHLPQLQMDRIFGISEHHTATGRVTMHEPNLQTVPKDIVLIEAAEKKEKSCIVNLRNAFISFKGGVLLAADYCQLELRILAHMSHDNDLLNVFNSDNDVFKSIAAQWKEKGINQVTDTERQQAKQTCYGMVYGIGAKSLSEQLNINEDDAARLLQEFKFKYKNMTKYMTDTINSCREKGYVTTVMGRRRYLPAITSDSPSSRSHAERQAVNTTIQGSAADLAKIAMIKIDKALTKQFACDKPYQCRNEKFVPTGASLVLQLHDELIYEVNSAILPRVAQIVKNEMECALRLSVQLPVKLKCGPSWGSFQEYTLVT